jgi:hypothetical protein
MAGWRPGGAIAGDVVMMLAPVMALALVTE